MRSSVRTFPGTTRNVSPWLTEARMLRVLREEKRKEEERAYEKQCEEIARLQDFVDRHIVRATSASAAQSRVKQLERMERIEKPIPPPPPPRFSFTYRDRPYERVLACEHFDLCVEGRTLLRDASFSLIRGQKCALTGDNGTGKTTLLKFFLSRDARVVLGKFVKIAYYDQENADLDPEERVLDCFWGKHSLLTQTEARKKLARAGLEAADMDKKVKSLSGGERAKLELALLQEQHGNVLFLDEPTNHLDLPAREALEEALRAFDGTLLFVSHDRYFIRAVATDVALIEDGTLTRFMGPYDDFLASRKEKQARESAPPEKRPAATGGYRSREERAQEAKRRTRTREIEARLTELEAEEARLTAEMTERAADYTAVQELYARIERLRAESDALYAEYETLI